MRTSVLHAAAVGVITETNAEQAIEELKAYEVRSDAASSSDSDAAPSSERLSS